MAIKLPSSEFVAHSVEGVLGKVLRDGFVHCTLQVGEFIMATVGINGGVVTLAAEGGFSLDSCDYPV